MSIQSENDMWTAGFVCAIGILLDGWGASTEVEELIKILGGLPPADEIDDQDREKLRQHGYLK